MSRWLTALLLVATLAVVSLFCVVILDEREEAFRTLLNQPEPTVFGVALNRPNLVEPGWYVRIPGLHELYRYDRRNRLLHSTPRSLVTVDRTLIDVDYYVVWRISDPRSFFESNRGDFSAALQRLDELSYSQVRETVNRHPLGDLLSPVRGEVEAAITTATDAALTGLGIQVLDVRLGGTLYPAANVSRVYDRMRTERNRFAMKFRAEGEQQARTLRSKADGESLVLLAQAEREALQLRGEGDAAAARVYADAYGSTPSSTPSCAARGVPQVARLRDDGGAVAEVRVPQVPVPARRTRARVVRPARGAGAPTGALSYSSICRKRQ
jgi:membrane protease subunit HflC